MAINNSEFISIAAKEFGSQCIVVSIDAKIKEDNYYVYDHKKSSSTFFEILDFSKRIESLGAGEILLNSVDRDGTGEGYDIDLINYVTNQIKIPVIACGGVGDWPDFKEALQKSNVDAVAAANIFHYRDQSVYLAKKYMYENKLIVRKPDLLTIN